MRTIGVLGGMAPESTAEYYRILISLSEERGWGKRYPEIVIYSLNFERFYNYLKAGKDAEVVSLLSDGINALERAGADFALMASNTPHMFFREVQENSSLSLLSIVDVTADEAERRGYAKIGLLGTNFTMRENFYRKGFENKDIRLFVPSEEEMNYIHDKIFKEIANGTFIEKTKKRLVQIVERMSKEDDIDAVVLGCTELPLLLDQDDVNLPTLNTTRIHARRALDYAVEE